MDNHRNFCAKLESLGVLPKFVTWTSSFLVDKSFRVKQESLLSHAIPSFNDVPKVSVIGFLLFLEMVSDLRVVLSQFCLFADDTNIVGITVQKANIQANLFAVNL